jgi:hypothetical protein
MSPRCPSPRCSHLVQSRRLQRTRAWTPRPYSSITGDEPPPLLASRRRRASAPTRWRRASVPAHGLLHTCAPPPAQGCATARRPPSLGLHAILLQTAVPGSTHQSVMVAASSRDAGERMIQQQASCLLCCFCMYIPSPILDLLYFCSSCLILLVPHFPFLI